MTELRLHIDEKPEELIKSIDTLNYFIKRQSLTNSFRNLIAKSRSTIKQDALNYIEKTLNQTSAISRQRQQQFFDYLKTIS